jgi:hypothetical protein
MAKKCVKEWGRGPFFNDSQKAWCSSFIFFYGSHETDRSWFYAKIFTLQTTLGRVASTYVYTIESPLHLSQKEAYTVQDILLLAVLGPDRLWWSNSAYFVWEKGRIIKQSNEGNLSKSYLGNVRGLPYPGHCNPHIVRPFFFVSSSIAN